MTTVATLKSDYKAPSLYFRGIGGRLVKFIPGSGVALEQDDLDALLTGSFADAVKNGEVELTDESGKVLEARKTPETPKTETPKTETQPTVKTETPSESSKKPESK